MSGNVAAKGDCANKLAALGVNGVIFFAFAKKMTPLEGFWTHILPRQRGDMRIGRLNFPTYGGPLVGKTAELEYFNLLNNNSYISQ